MGCIYSQDVYKGDSQLSADSHDSLLPMSSHPKLLPPNHPCCDGPYPSTLKAEQTRRP